MGTLLPVVLASRARISEGAQRFMPKETVIIGAGPAGLTAGYELQKAGCRSILLEADRQTGGMSRTLTFDGCRFDLGGHRFFTKIPEVQALWDELLGDRFLVRPRLSRIAYDGKLFHYPLQIGEALRQLGLARSLGIVASYLAARINPTRPEDTFEAWVSNRFGRRLYEMFFKTYTEKVWGMSCTELSADWAAQRIRELSLWRVLTEKLFGVSKSHSLIEEFNYPPLGPQEMWDELARRLEIGGQTIHFSRRASRVNIRDGRFVQVETTDPQGATETWAGDSLVSTMALNELALILDPAPPDAVLEAARALRYRGHITVCAIVEAEAGFDDNWIYIHSPEIRMARLQNYSNWSEAMSPEPGVTALGLEYLAWPGDETWTMPDDDLVALGFEEFRKLDLMPADRVRSGFVARSGHAYPVYDPGYRERINTIRDYLATIPNLVTCGRCGMHRYNNMDHSMLTGMLAARNLLGESNDLWSVNLESEYIEEKRSGA